MPASDTYVLFKRTHCATLGVTVRTQLRPALIAKLRACLPLKKSKSSYPLRFAGSFPGDGKENVGIAIEVQRVNKYTYEVFMAWFTKDLQPPPSYGRVKDFFDCLSEPMTDKQAIVTAAFDYDEKDATSVFKPIQLGDKVGILDEIIGFTGIKKDPEGRMLYRLSVSLTGDGIRHQVGFQQSVALSADLPLSLVENASRISTLALKPKSQS
jgi:hypothetical protein